MVFSSCDVNYESKHAPYCMRLHYFNDNTIKLGTSAGVFEVINKNIKSEGEFWNFVSRIRKECRTKSDYSFEDYLRDNNLIDVSQVEEANKELQRQCKSYDALMKWIGDNRKRSL